MSDLELVGNTLKAKGDLYWDNENEFVTLMEKLLVSEHDAVRIDVSEVKFLFSPFVSHLVRFCLTAKEAGKRPEIVIGPALADTFNASGLAAELPIVSKQP